MIELLLAQKLKTLVLIPVFLKPTTILQYNLGLCKEKNCSYHFIYIDLFFLFYVFFFFLTFHILRKWMIFPKKSLVLDKLKLDMDDAQLVKNNNN